MSHILEQIISLEKFNNAKSHDLIEYKCHYCKEIKYKKKSLITSLINIGQNYIFCGNSCATLFQNLHLGKPPTKEELEILINERLSTYSIAKKFGRSFGSIRYWLKYYGLKTNPRYKRKENTPAIKTKRIPKINLNLYNWGVIQTFYDQNHTWKEVQLEFKIQLSTLSAANKVGFFKSRTSKETWLLRNPQRIGKKLSTETKEKLRLARLEYLSKNPDSWKRNDKFKSIPCQTVKERLIQLNIKFVEEFQPLLHLNRFFRIDISFPDIKLGFEINGGQHYDTNSKLKPYYQSRHDLIVSEGWKLYEIPYHVAMRKLFVEDFILPILNRENPKYNIDLYISKSPRLESNQVSTQI